MYKKLLYGLALVLIGIRSVFCQSDSVSFEKVRITPLPVMYYSPETKFGLGGLVAVNFNSSVDSLTTGSYAQSFFLYTMNKQYNWDNTFRYYTPQNKLIYQGKFSMTYFPELYFGIATEQPLAKEDLIKYNRLSAEFKVYREIRKSTYVGIATRYTRIYNIDSESGGSFSLDKPIGYGGYQLLGVAPLISFESRKSQVYPRNGMFAEMQLMVYPEMLHQSYGFLNTRIDVRKYFPVNWLSDRDVIALQFFMTSNSGAVPFKEMADIGGNVIMRGYYTGFYRYNNLYAFQAEIRAGLWRFIGIDFWLGAALTPRKWYSLGDTGIKPNAGVGLRFMINDKDRLNIRADYGFGKQRQRGFYLDIAEAY
ncbi:BamA/TamA family outer membrane protein [Algoriphagus resistens]|uniref:hypothetical protein n=1 Tax=Algoriphagus resistens TaxID=1750590 RepID=UPI00071691EF|nr:hypothetical protein [Algoriphagus resistens]